MRKILPNQDKGYTLVELLVVVSIIAILSLIALTVYTNIQRSSRDARRRADIEAIAKALEVNKTDVGYQSLADSQFAGGKIPALDPTVVPYCLSSTKDVGDPTTWDKEGCSDSTNFSTVSSTTPTADSGQFKVCTTLENGGNPQVYCMSNQQ